MAVYLTVTLTGLHIWKTKKSDLFKIFTLTINWSFYNPFIAFLLIQYRKTVNKNIYFDD